MKTRPILFLSILAVTIPAAAAAETAVVEATVTKAGKRTQLAALTLDVAADGSRTEAEAVGAGGVFDVAVWREPTRAKPGRFRFRIDLHRGRDGQFKLRSARAIKPGTRTVVGAFRQAGGELLEIAVTTSP